MSPFVYFTSLAVLLIAGSRSGTAQLSCYQCGYTTTTSVVPSSGNTNCLQVSTSTQVVNASGLVGCKYCSISVTGGGSSPSSAISYSRNCMTDNQFTGTMCTSSFLGTTCMCNTTNCNSQPFMTGSLSCYACNSMAGINTGCEDPFASTSSFVGQIQGCTACTKTISPAGSTGGVTYSRGCLYGNATNSLCAAGACNSYCTTNLCNSASTVASSVVMAAFLLLISSCY